MSYLFFGVIHEDHILQNKDVHVSDMYQILILYGYSWIRTHEVSKLIILIFLKYFIGYI